MPQAMTEFSMACRGNGLLKTLPLRYYKHLYWVFLGQIKWLPSRALGKLSSWLGLTYRVSKSLDGGGQASNSLRDTWYTREWQGYRPAWGRQWLVLSWEQSPGPCTVLWAAAVPGSLLLPTLLLIQNMQKYTQRKWRARMEKELQLQAQPEINKLSTPAPRQAGYGDWKLSLETPQAEKTHHQATKTEL